MMQDDYLRELTAVWQTQEHDADAVLRRLRNSRWRPHLLLAAEALACGVALFTGVWFVRAAGLYPSHRLLFSLSAAVVLVTVPALFVASVISRRSAFAWCDETPQTLLQIGVQRAEASLKALRWVWWHFIVVGCFLVVLWVCQLFGLIHALGFLVFYTTVCAASCLAWWRWIVWRKYRLRSERDSYARLLEEIQVD